MRRPASLRCTSLKSGLWPSLALVLLVAGTTIPQFLSGTHANFPLAFFGQGETKRGLGVQARECCDAMTLAGLDPAIFGSVYQHLIHWATGPHICVPMQHPAIFWSKLRLTDPNIRQANLFSCRKTPDALFPHSPALCPTPPALCCTLQHFALRGTTCELERSTHDLTDIK